MLYLVCFDCKVGLRICPGEPGELENLLGVLADGKHYRLTCFKCDLDKAELIVPETHPVPADISLFDVNPQEAFAALNGLGLPGEQDCSAAFVEQVFLTKKVVAVCTQWIRGSHRCTIESIEFEDGLKMYLGASSSGAIVYRLAPKHSYVKEIERGG